MNSHFTQSHPARIALLSIALILGACASAPKVRVDQDKNVNVSAYRTFAWFEPQTNADAAAKVNTLNTQRVRNALQSTLESKGYTFDAARPDFRVAHLLNMYERPKDSGMRIGLGAGGGSGHVGAGVGLSIPVGKRTNMVGALTVDIVDAARNAQVWTAAYEDKLGAEPTDAEIQKLVDTALSKLPSRSRE